MTGPVYIAANGAAQPVFYTLRKETPVKPDEKLEAFHLVVEVPNCREAKPLFGSPKAKPRAPEGTAVVIALAWALGFMLGALVTAAAGWM